MVGRFPLTPVVFSLGLSDHKPLNILLHSLPCGVSKTSKHPLEPTNLYLHLGGQLADHSYIRTAISLMFYPHFKQPPCPQLKISKLEHLEEKTFFLSSPPFSPSTKNNFHTVSTRYFIGSFETKRGHYL